jgi:hypothetical protein
MRHSLTFWAVRHTLSLAPTTRYGVRHLRSIRPANRPEFSELMWFGAIRVTESGKTVASVSRVQVIDNN